MLKLPAMIVTLGTMTIYKSLSLVISNATTIAGFPNKEHWFFTVFGGLSRITHQTEEHVEHRLTAHIGVVKAAKNGKYWRFSSTEKKGLSIANTP